MCSFKDDRSVQVCDLAIGHVRADVQKTFGDIVQFTSLEGGGTLVRADRDVDPDVFGERTRAAIAAAQSAAR